MPAVPIRAWISTRAMSRSSSRLRSSSIAIQRVTALPGNRPLPLDGTPRTRTRTRIGSPAALASQPSWVRVAAAAGSSAGQPSSRRNSGAVSRSWPGTVPSICASAALWRSTPPASSKTICPSGDSSNQPCSSPRRSSIAAAPAPSPAPDAPRGWRGSTGGRAFGGVGGVMDIPRQSLRASRADAARGPDNAQRVNLQLLAADICWMCKTSASAFCSISWRDANSPGARSCSRRSCASLLSRLSFSQLFSGFWFW